MRKNPAKQPQPEKPQLQRFIETARELECDEDEAAFDEKLKRIATAKPKPKATKTGGQSQTADPTPNKPKR
jgi:hypothetical protein